MEIKEVFPRPVQVVLGDGNTYELSLPTCGDLSAIEEHFGMSFVEAFAGGIDWSVPSNVAYIALLLLKERHPNVHPDELMDLLSPETPGNILCVFEGIVTALGKSRPTEEMTLVAHTRFGQTTKDRITDWSWLVYRLCKDPFPYTPWDVEKMTLRQVYLVLIDLGPYYKELNSFDPVEHAKLMEVSAKDIWKDYKPFEESND